MTQQVEGQTSTQLEKVESAPVTGDGIGGTDGGGAVRVEGLSADPTGDANRDVVDQEPQATLSVQGLAKAAAAQQALAQRQAPQQAQPLTALQRAERAIGHLVELAEHELSVADKAIVDEAHRLLRRLGFLGSNSSQS